MALGFKLQLQASETSKTISFLDLLYHPRLLLSILFSFGFLVSEFQSTALIPVYFVSFSIFFFAMYFVHARCKSYFTCKSDLSSSVLVQREKNGFSPCSFSD